MFSPPDELLNELPLNLEQDPDLQSGREAVMQTMTAPQTAEEIGEPVVPRCLRQRREFLEETFEAWS